MVFENANVYPCRRVKGENNKGDPKRRAFIIRLAEKFYRSFRDIPVSAIGDLTSFGWPDITDRAVRLVLTSERKGEIADQVKLEIDKENTAKLISTGIINKSNRRAPCESDKSGQT